MKSKKKVRFVESIIREGKLDEESAKSLHNIGAQFVNIRNAGRDILESYHRILDAMAAVRLSVNTMLDNIEDVENLNEKEERKHGKQ